MTLDTHTHTQRKWRLDRLLNEIKWNIEPFSFRRTWQQFYRGKPEKYAKSVKILVYSSNMFYCVVFYICVKVSLHHTGEFFYVSPQNTHDLKCF